MFRRILRKDVKKAIIFVVLGVRVTGPWRNFSVLNSFSLSPSHIHSDSPIIVGAIDAINYDYVMVVEEETAKQNGWLKQ